MKRIVLYTHGSKEDAYDKGKAAGLKGEALSRFMYTGSEHKMTYAVNEQTGEASLVEVDDHKMVVRM